MCIGIGKLKSLTSGGKQQINTKYELKNIKELYSIRYVYETTNTTKSIYYNGKEEYKLKLFNLLTQKKKKSCLLGRFCRLSYQVSY